MIRETNSGHVTYPVEAIVKDVSFAPAQRSPRENLIFGDAVLSTDARYTSELRLLEPLQTFDTNSRSRKRTAFFKSIGSCYKTMNNINSPKHAFVDML